MLIHFLESTAAFAQTAAQAIPPMPDTAPVVTALPPTGIIHFIETNASLVFGLLWGFCETIALIPQVKSNSVFTLVFNTLNSLKGMFQQTPKV